MLGPVCLDLFEDIRYFVRVHLITSMSPFFRTISDFKSPNATLARFSVLAPASPNAILLIPSPPYISSLLFSSPLLSFTSWCCHTGLSFTGPEMPSQKQNYVAYIDEMHFVFQHSSVLIPNQWSSSAQLAKRVSGKGFM
jgi:hypothetical protein